MRLGQNGNVCRFVCRRKGGDFFVTVRKSTFVNYTFCNFLNCATFLFRRAILSRFHRAFVTVVQMFQSSANVSAIRFVNCSLDLNAKQVFRSSLVGKLHCLELGWSVKFSKPVAEVLTNILSPPSDRKQLSHVSSEELTHGGRSQLVRRFSAYACSTSILLKNAKCWHRVLQKWAGSSDFISTFTSTWRIWLSNSISCRLSFKM